MRSRLTLLLLVEIAVLAFLIVQVVGARDAAPEMTGGSEVHDVATAAEAPNPSAAISALDERVRDSTPRESTRTELPVPFDPDDPVGVLLTGMVRWPDGSAAVATVLADSGNKRVGKATARDGSYAIAGLHPGEWSFRLQAQGGVQTTLKHTLTDAPTQTHDFVIDRSFAVRVRIITPDGSDATRALRIGGIGRWDFQVVGQRERLPDQLAPTTLNTLAIGDARWQGDMNPVDGNAGTLHLRESPPAHVGLLLGSRLLEQQIVQPGQDLLTFTVDVDALVQNSALVQVRVLDAETGAPLTKARVGLNYAGAFSTGIPVDAEGRSEQRAAEGIVHVGIIAPDRERYVAVLHVGKEPIDLGEVRLGPVQPLTGRVLDTDGNPIAADVTWTELKWRTSPTEFHLNRSTSADTEGTFRLHGTGRGRIAVQARTSDQRIAVGVFDNPSAGSVELRVAAGAICEISRPVDPAHAFTVTVFDAGRNPVAAPRLESNRMKQKILLPAGTYTYEVHDDHARLVQSGKMELGATPTTLVIR